jgi:gliding motility-associated-like protein
MRIILLFLLIIISISNSYSQLTVTPSNTGTALAQKLVGNGVTISNVTFTAFRGSCGFFKSVNTPVNLDSGIVLTSGIVKTDPTLFIDGIDGNAFGEVSNTNGQPGDASLTSILGVGLQSRDASVLEFDFIPLGDTISFNYIFSSEEYPDYVCTEYNDIFAFIISGPGITGTKNIALIPNTTLPVTINNINGGVAGPSGINNLCLPGFPYTNLYKSNSAGTILTHNGLTVKLKAISKVIPCETYHLKIAIADAGPLDPTNPDIYDDELDSGVFIEANSLSSNSTTITTGGSFDPVTGSYYLAEGCVAGTVTFELKNPSLTPTIVNLAIGGTATNGVDVTLIPTTITIPANQTTFNLPLTAFNDALVEGREVLKIYTLAAGCNSTIYTDSAIIEIRDFQKLALNPADTVSVCEGRTLQLDAVTGYTTYTWDANPTLSNVNIKNPIANPTISPTTYYCTAVLGICKARDSVRVEFNTLKLKSKQDINCKDATTGIISVSHGKGWAPPLRFSLNGGPTQLDSTFSGLSIGNYSVTLTDVTGCSKTIPVSLIQAFPDLTFTEAIASPGCISTGTITVTVNGGLAPYTYSANGVVFQTNNSLSISQPGPYTIYVRDANNCLTTKNVIVGVPPTVDFTRTIKAATCSGNADGEITITPTTGASPFQYSSNNGVSFQTSNILKVNIGNQTIVVKDANGCTKTEIISVPLNNTVVVKAGVPQTICEGTSKQITGQSNATTNNWTPNFNITNTNTLTPTVSPNITTKYYLTGTTGICSQKDSVIITVRPAPISIAGLDTFICFGESVKLTGSGGTKYQWEPAANILNSNNQSITVNPLITTKYWLTVEDINGCKSIIPDTVTVRVVDKVIAFAGNDTLVADNQPLQLNATGAVTYLWSPIFNLSNPTIANPIFQTNQLGTYTYSVVATTLENCFGIDEIKITVYKGPEIYVPTAFTPNGDSYNNILRISAVGLKSFKYYRVFNRWGQLVFSTKDPVIGWDGFFKNIQQPAGTYVWFVEGVDYFDKLIQKKGTVLLIR